MCSCVVNNITCSTHCHPNEKSACQNKSKINSQFDLHLVKSNKWLTDREIFAASKLLKETFTQNEGLQDPVLGQKNQWPHPEGEFVQCLHVNGNHWITISNIGNCEGVINIYDSMQQKPSKETLNAIARFLRSDATEIKVCVRPVQVQDNGTDCGIFAIAFASSLLHGQDPCKINYLEPRKHLYQCLDTSNMTEFPHTDLDADRSDLSIYEENINLGCYCRGVLEGLPTVKCDLCTFECHKVCAMVTRNTHSWHCNICRKYK